MPDSQPPAPVEVTLLVESFVNSEHRDAAKYDNRSLLDQSGVWNLHDLAARIYALGFKDGRTVESVRENGMRQRERDAARAAASAGEG